MDQLKLYKSLKNYIEKQQELIVKEYELEKEKKQESKTDSLQKIDLIFVLRSKAPPGTIRKWTTTVVFKLNWEEMLARHQCSISFAPNDIVHRRKIESLRKLNDLNDDLKNMLCRNYPKIRKIPTMNLHLPRNYAFNNSQIRAIQMAVSNPFSLIQGPPGTGKTHTIGAIAIQALKNEPKKKVLICGTTNVSITSLLEIVGDMVQGEGLDVCWPAAKIKRFSNRIRYY